MSLQFEILKRAKDRYQKALIAESTAQGHYLTGNLQRAQTAEFTESPNSIRVVLLMPRYGLYVNTGVVAKAIPFQEGSGRKTSKYIDGLTQFWILRGLPPKEAKKAAFATAKKHKKVGMPSPGSFRFSRNGRRVGFINWVIQENRAKVAAQVTSETKTEFRKLLGQIKRGVI